MIEVATTILYVSKSSTKFPWLLTTEGCKYIMADKEKTTASTSRIPVKTPLKPVNKVLSKVVAANKLKRRSLTMLNKAATPHVRPPMSTRPSLQRPTVAPTPRYMGRTASARSRDPSPAAKKPRTGFLSTVPPQKSRSTLMEEQIEQLKERLSLADEKMATAEEKIATLKEIIEMKNDVLESRQSKIEALEMKLEQAKLNLEINREMYESVKLLEQEQKQKIEALTQELQQTVEQSNKFMEDAREADMKARELLNAIVDIKGQIRVAVRVRPALPKETSMLEFSYPTNSTIKLDSAKPINMEFQHVFGPRLNQDIVYEQVDELVQSSLSGYNVALIAYGQTGSGKTYTLIGGEGVKEGIIPRAGRSIFNSKVQLEKMGWKIKVSASFVEVYMEELYDLLNKRTKLTLKTSGGASQASGVFSKDIESEDDIAWVLHKASAARSVAATKCNEQNSRSHAVFQLNIESSNEALGKELSSTLSLVDLAGSERAKDSGSDENKERFKEMTTINQGLSALMKCIRAQQQKNAHIPYRDSKLTTLLMSTLGGGNSKTMVIVGLNPAISQEAETRRSLEFAQQMSLTTIGSATGQLKQ